MFFGIMFGYYLGDEGRARAADRLLTVLALVGISMPVFVLAAVMLKFLAYDPGYSPRAGTSG